MFVCDGGWSLGTTVCGVEEQHSVGGVLGSGYFFKGVSNNRSCGPQIFGFQSIYGYRDYKKFQIMI